MSLRFELVPHEKNGSPTLRLRGHLSYLHARAMTTQINTLLRAPDAGDIYLDCGGVTHLDSSGLGVLHACQGQAKRYNRRVHVINPSPILKFWRCYELP